MEDRQLFFEVGSEEDDGVGSRRLVDRREPIENRLRVLRLLLRRLPTQRSKRRGQEGLVTEVGQRRDGKRREGRRRLSLCFVSKFY